jgi:phosphatidylinositol alpha-mannosyltransferase
MVCPYSLTQPGGVQGQVLDLARVLRGRGHMVRVLGPCDGPPPDAGVTPLGNSIPTSANGSLAPIAPDPAAQLRLMRALRDEQFDILHLHEPLAPGPTTTAIVLKPAPLVGTYHAAGRSRSYEVLGFGVRRLAKRIDKNFVVSEDAEILVQSSLGGSYERVFNAVSLAMFEAAEPEPTSGPTIFFIGRHEERKGLEVLIDAMAKLPSNYSLWIGGDGPETARLKDRAAGDGRISWLGRVSEAEKVSRMKGCSVFCAPSLHGESFGIVLIEAMAAGAAVIASDIDGYRKVARDGSDAALVPPGDVQALTAEILALHDEDARRWALVRSGRLRAQDFSMGELADRYMTSYEALLAR